MAVVLGRIIDQSHYELQHRMEVVKAATHPGNLKLLAYWRECDARGGMRMGLDIPSRAIAPLLKDLCVAEPVGDWIDARIRLAGSTMTEYFGQDVSGLLMSQIIGDNRESDFQLMMNGARYATANNATGAVEHSLVDNGRVVLRQEIMVVPIWSPDADARWLVTGTFNF
ncbi:MAG TPA: PAS domain-containing protein [Rhizomicrobium sp.]|jgi:hypothetical protein